MLPHRFRILQDRADPRSEVLMPLKPVKRVGPLFQIRGKDCKKGPRKVNRPRERTRKAQQFAKLRPVLLLAAKSNGAWPGFNVRCFMCRCLSPSPTLFTRPRVQSSENRAVRPPLKHCESTCRSRRLIREKVFITGFSRAMPSSEAHRTLVSCPARNSEKMVMGGWPTVAIV